MKGSVTMETMEKVTDDGVLDLTKRAARTPEVRSSSLSTVSTVSSDLCYIGEQEEALNLSMKKSPASSTPSIKPATETSQGSLEILGGASKPLKHSQLLDKSRSIEGNQLVECETFSSLGKIQPYTVSMSTNSLLLMDFHCHLTTSEVVGYLGGKWDQSTQHLSIQQAFPCRCRLGDGQNATLVEEEIRVSMRHMGMSLVGWYHSHPYSVPEPSIRDIECQMSYQLKMKGAKANYFPCVGIINSPYYSKSLRTESTSLMYMVLPPQEDCHTDCGIPMLLKYSTKQNHSVSEDLLNEMKKLCEFYRGSPDWITFPHTWQPGVTFLEKLKTSLNNKLPEDQIDSGTFLDFVQHVLTVKT